MTYKDKHEYDILEATMEKEVMENLYRIQCEKILNETWAKALFHYDKIKEIVDRGQIKDKNDETMLLIAANAALQKMTFDKAVDASLSLNIPEEMAMCGRTEKRKCPCDRDICLVSLRVQE